jgi:hypothetical protein
MEVKIYCPCGSKFKFDVEPVNGRLPVPVSCPACGVDATAQANEIIAASLASSLPSQPVMASPPADAPAGLRLNRPAPGASGAPPAFPTAPASRPAPPAFSASKPSSSASADKAFGTLKKVGAGLVAAFGAFVICFKLFRMFHFVAAVTSAMHSNSGTAAGDDAGGAKNLWYDNCAVVFVKQTNDTEVADACREFWKTSLKKNLTLVNEEKDSFSPGEYQLLPAHNGYVRIIGAHEWPALQEEELVIFLSQKFSTLAFEWRSESFADTYHFGVYDGGERKFHSQMDIKPNSEGEEIVTTEGDDYATANGFTPGAKGFKEFNVLDADKITRHLGMRLWDEKDGVALKGRLLKEAGAAGN